VGLLVGELDLIVFMSLGPVSRLLLRLRLLDPCVNKRLLFESLIIIDFEFLLLIAHLL
jgi:hypothetical protein